MTWSALLVLALLAPGVGSAADVITGGAGGAITRAEKIEPGFAVSVSRS